MAISLQAINAVKPPGYEIDFATYKENMEESLKNILVQVTPQSGRTFFHACLSEWFMMGQTSDLLQQAVVAGQMVQRAGTRKLMSLFVLLLLLLLLFDV